MSPIYRDINSPSPIKRIKEFKVDTIGERSKRRANAKKEKMKRVVEERKIAQKHKEEGEVTLQPMLNYTMNSKTAKKVGKKRSNHFQSHNISVFDCLYHDAERISSKRQIEKLKIEEEISINQNKERRKSRVQVFSTF